MFKFIKYITKLMSGLNNMRKRLNYHGGADQHDRMVADKRWSLENALKYSYQAETAQLTNGDFRCLINPNKLTMENDDKILSIPFSARPKNGGEVADISLSVGDVIKWIETDTYWILYQRYLQENAYYRFAMRQCSAEVELPDGTKLWAYVKGLDEKGIDWVKSKHFIFNDLNYTLEIYISKNTKTLELFQRFKKLKVYGKNWEVQAKDEYTTEGIIVAYVKEDYSNEWAQQEPIEHPEVSTFVPTKNEAPKILGETQVYPYDIKTYEIQNATGGQWLLSNSRAKILSQTESSVTIEITTGKSGSVSLIYRTSGKEDLIQNISILSL